MVTHSKALRLGVEEDILLESLIKATGECIEEDGHLVCNWGKTQRILAIFQGYTPRIEITATVAIEASDIFQTRVTVVIRDYLTNFEDDNPAS